MKSDQLPKNLGKCVVDVVSLITVSDLLDVLINKKNKHVLVKYVGSKMKAHKASC